MLVSQMLRYARVLLTAGWCQGAEAHDEQGQPVEPSDVMAVSWSLAGAIRAAARDAGDEEGELERDASAALALVLETPADELPAWNDDPRRTRRDVLAACDCAVELVPELVAQHVAVVGGGR
jgi:hypothetical protein